MAEQTRWRQLVQTPLVSIGDYRCRPADLGRGPVETSTTGSIVLLRSGAFVKHVRGEEVVADVNHVVFFYPDEPYHVSHPVACGDECTVFRLRADVLTEMAAACDPAAVERPERPIDYTHAPSAPRSYMLHRLLVHGLQTAHLTELASEEISLVLLEGVLNEAHRSHGLTPPRRRADTSRAHREQVDAAIVMLCRRFRERVTLDDLATQVHSSPFHLSRIFRRQTGQPMHAYLNRLRLRHALDMLLDDEPNLTHVALACGYYDHGHFSNAFRREFGLTPSHCRRADLREFVQMSKTFQA